MSTTAQGQLGFILLQKMSDNGMKLKCFLCFMTTLESQSHDITHIHSWQETESAPTIHSLPHCKSHVTKCQIDALFSSDWFSNCDQGSLFRQWRNNDQFYGWIKWWQLFSNCLQQSAHAVQRMRLLPSFGFTVFFRIEWEFLLDDQFCLNNFCIMCCVISLTKQEVPLYRD